MSYTNILYFTYEIDEKSREARAACSTRIELELIFCRRLNLRTRHYRLYYYDILCVGRRIYFYRGNLRVPNTTARVCVCV